MLKSCLGYGFLSVIVIATLCGCGSSGGSTSYFSTVTLTPTVLDPQNTTSIVLLAGNLNDTFRSVAIQSAPYGNPLTPSPTTVTLTKIVYTKTANSPSAPKIDDQLQNYTVNIPSGGIRNFSINVASGIFKDNLVSLYGFGPGSTVWEYYITYYFTAIEDYTNKAESFSVAGGSITFR